MVIRSDQGSRLLGVATLAKFVELGKALITLRDLDELLHRIAQVAGLVLSADVVVLYEYTEIADDVITPPIVWGDIRYPEVIARRRGEQLHRASVVFRMLQEDAPFFASNAEEDWFEHCGAKPPFLAREGVVSSAAIPLTAYNRRLGLLFVNYRRVCSFDDETRKVIELFGTQAAIAIYTARWLREEQALRRQAEALRDVSDVASSAKELKIVAESVLEQLGDIVPYSKASLQIIRGDVRELIAYIGPGESVPDEWLQRPVSQDPLVRGIVVSKRVRILSTRFR
jgi:GAF domain-containing protein